MKDLKGSGRLQVNVLTSGTKPNIQGDNKIQTYSNIASVVSIIQPKYMRDMKKQKNISHREKHNHLIENCPKLQI